MAYIPKDARWFLADLVEEIRVEGSKRNVVHINSVLIEARTPETAYKKALALGKAGTLSYKNIHGKEVVKRFLGLRSLDVIPFPLEHGCEIMFVEKLGVTPKGLRKLVRKKEELEAFLPVRDRPGRPDYAAGDIVREIYEELAKREKKRRHVNPTREACGRSPQDRQKKTILILAWPRKTYVFRPLNLNGAL